MAGLHEAGELLLSHGKEHIWAHSLEVAEEIGAIAGQYGLDVRDCETAALCHDIGGILPPEEMLAQAVAEGILLDPAEERYPFLLHQRFSKRLCGVRLGIENQAVLDAVGCHTTLRPGASALDMALFLADKLRWDQPGVPPYEAIVREKLGMSLERACLVYIDFSLDSGRVLMPHRLLLEARSWLIPFSVSS